MKIGYILRLLEKIPGFHHGPRMCWIGLSDSVPHTKVKKSSMGRFPFLHKNDATAVHIEYKKIKEKYLILRPQQQKTVKKVLNNLLAFLFLLLLLGFTLKSHWDRNWRYFDLIFFVRYLDISSIICKQKREFSDTTFFSLLYGKPKVLKS